MTARRHLVGIDLGTVNSALAAVDLARGGDLAAAVRELPVPQLVAPGDVRERTLLPSCAYLPGPELAAGARRLPWGDRAVVVGELAREQGARVPGRVVTSAKSWLANARADRTAPILPWGAPEGVPRISPVAASALYLAHLRDAWDHSHPDAPLAEQEVVVTVPASFDEVARELTLAAAREAGLGAVTLLEEPQAAFHDWASRHRADPGGALGDARLVLVVDVGGGTTDLTLVAAGLQDGRPTFTRLAVGDHLLLGGDNVDLALARAAESRLGERLDAARFASLVHACRLAKERLLRDDAPPEVAVAVVGRGSHLLESVRSTPVARDEARRVLLDGFFPAIGRDERPRRAPRTAGLAELGLPYETEPAVTRHVAAFLAAHAGESGEEVGGLARPDAILVNGGTLTPPEVRERLREVVSSWFPGTPPVRLLASAAPELAVARGAVWAALARRGIGVRIGGGTPRAYYVGIATPDGEQALCVVPRHLDEGSRITVPRPFALAVGRPVRFALWASSARFERPGDVVPVSDDLVTLPAVEAVLGGEEASRAAATRGAAELPVRLEAVLTEIGTLELWCAAVGLDARWKLEFSLRGVPEDRGEARAEASGVPRRLEEANALVELYYGKRAGVDPRAVKGLFRELERLLGPRERWPTALVRALWGALHAGRARRRRSADHERVWLQLTGFCLRPGFGAPLDGWRARETFAVFGEGLQHQGDPRAWQAWWVLWRRIAGGLDAEAQEGLYAALAPFVRPRDPRRPPPRVPGVKPEALDEMIRLAASLERIDPARKAEMGEWILARLEADGPAPHLLWAIGRIGARVPFAASAHLAVPADTAAAWMRRLLASPAPRAALAFPLAQLARRSGNRARDHPDELRAEVLSALAEGGAPEEALRAVREVVAVSDADEQRVFGESLPLACGSWKARRPRTTAHARTPSPRGRARSREPARRRSVSGGTPQAGEGADVTACSRTGHGARHRRRRRDRAVVLDADGGGAEVLLRQPADDADHRAGRVEPGPARALLAGRVDPPAHERAVGRDGHVEDQREAVRAGEVHPAVGREVPEGVDDEPALHDLHPAHDVRAVADDEIGAGLDDGAGEGAQVAAVLAEEALVTGGHVLAIGALGAAVHRDDDEVGALLRLRDDPRRLGEVAQVVRAGGGRERDDRDAAAADLEARHLARRAGVADAEGVERGAGGGRGPRRRSRPRGCSRGRRRPRRRRRGACRSGSGRGRRSSGRASSARTSRTARSRRGGPRGSRRRRRRRRGVGPPRRGAPSRPRAAGARRSRRGTRSRA